MINSELEVQDVQDPHNEAVEKVVQSGMRGTVALAGMATAVVIALWIAFYLLVFVPRGAAP